MKPFSLLPVILLIACTSKPVAPPDPLPVVPNSSQMEWHEMEMNAFVHFTINTFTDKEWGYGDESPFLFNPDSLDIDQWVSVFKETGFKGVILTCKHHDGFCLWPSAWTEHSVKNSPLKTDIVYGVSQACKKHGLKFGIYLSPWDRNHAQYGKPEYITYYRKQLKELFSKYGPVFEMWFDGANGGDGYYGGVNETRKINGATYYDWPNTLDIIRGMEPNVIFFSDAGPGVRWVGNERGVAGETNWNTISSDTLFAGKGGINQLLNRGDELGTKWIPAEVDVSIRPGWFYHPKEDTLVKSPQKLFEIYLTSVGRGSTLLLNIPPDRHGKIHRHDVAALRGFREKLDNEFKNDLAQQAKVMVSSIRGNHDAYAGNNLIDRNKETYWATDNGVTSGSVELTWEEEKTIQYIMLQEYIRLGQRIKSFSVEALVGDSWVKIAEGTTVGYKRILRVEPIRTQRIRINMLDAKNCIVLSNLSVY